MSRRWALAMAVLFVAATGAALGPWGPLGDSSSTTADGRPARGAPTTVPEPSTTTTEVRPERFTLSFTGDLLTHDPVLDQARANGGAAAGDFDFTPMLAEVKPLLTASDLAVCHLEVPLSRDNTRLASYPSFNAPRELADAIATSYDGCSVASNHALDQGPPGVVSTLDVLDAAGVAHAGTARSAAESTTPRLYELDGGVTVGHVSATYGLNGRSLPPGQPWLVDLIGAEVVLERATAARRAGADFVVVSLHWGEEFRTEPTPEQRSLATTLLASPDVDLIVGHHAHVLQPIERVGDEVVVFGLGNFLSNQSARCCVAASQDGAIVTLTVERAGRRWVVGDVAFTPTWVDRDGYRVLPVAAALDDPATSAADRSELAESWARTMAVLGRDPALARPTEVPAGT